MYVTLCVTVQLYVFVLCDSVSTNGLIRSIRWFHCSLHFIDHLITHVNRVGVDKGYHIIQ